MGIVKISDRMHDNLRLASDAFSRSINAQAEHWMRMGMLAELHPGLAHGELCRLLMRAQADGSDCLQFLAPAAVRPARAVAAPAAARQVVR